MSSFDNKTADSYKLTIIESEADRAAFFNALENLPKPTKRLVKASALRKKLVPNAN